MRRHAVPRGLPGIRFHDLRHSHTTQLLAEQVRPDVVTERLGHSSVAFTLQVYGHRYAGDQRSGRSRSVRSPPHSGHGRTMRRRYGTGGTGSVGVDILTIQGDPRTIRELSRTSQAPLSPPTTPGSRGLGAFAGETDAEAYFGPSGANGTFSPCTAGCALVVVAPVFPQNRGRASQAA